LFRNLCKLQASQRYTAKDALKHPWITRNNTDHVPLTPLEKMSQLEQEDDLRKKMNLAYFLSVSKMLFNPNYSFNTRDFIEYKSKIKNFARKIDKWHESNVLKRQQTFEADSEFRFELSSPDNIAGFASSSDDELGRDMDGGSAHDSKPSSYHQLPSSMASKRGRKVQDRVRAGKKGYER
jgi:serine/threonine protein kinase